MVHAVNKVGTTHHAMTTAAPRRRPTMADPTDVVWKQSPTASYDTPFSIRCLKCGWQSPEFEFNVMAFTAAQEHEDIEHEGSEIEWSRIH